MKSRNVAATILCLCLALSIQASAGLDGWIVTESTHDGDHDIWAMRADGTDLTQLTNMSGNESYPHWSPDSGQIAYATGGAAGLWVYDWWSGANTRVYDAHNYQGQNLGSFVAWPRWSPGGNKILFMEDSHFTVINADGTGRQTIPGIQGVVGRATWSPDGQAFVYQMRNDVGNPESYDLWICDFTQSGDIMAGVNQRLTEGANSVTTIKGPADWAPNGLIAFTLGYNLALLDPGHSPDWGDPLSPDVTLLTTDASFSSLTYWNPSWSPDLSHLIYSRAEGGTSDLWTMDLSTLSQTRLLALSGGEGNPDWGNPVPAPGAILLGGVGMGVIGWLRRLKAL